MPDEVAAFAIDHGPGWPFLSVSQVEGLHLPAK
jgi:hypothetical protein